MTSPHLDFDRFEARYGRELVDIAGEGGWNSDDGRQIDRDLVNTAIDYANNYIDGHVLGRYPNGAQSDVLTGVAMDIARYRLRSEQNNATISEEVRKRYEDALKLLREVESGKHLLVGSDGRQIGEADGAGGSVATSVMTTGFTPERNPHILDGYHDG